MRLCKTDNVKDLQYTFGEDHCCWDTENELGKASMNTNR